MDKEKQADACIAAIVRSADEFRDMCKNPDIKKYLNQNRRIIHTAIYDLQVALVRLRNRGNM